jgi:hypothetical protein
MLTFEFEQPMLISGVIINEKALKHLSYIQTGSSYINDANYRKFNNGGVTEYINDCNEIIHMLFEALLQADQDDRPKIIDVLERAYCLLSTFKRLELPDEVIDNFNKKVA